MEGTALAGSRVTCNLSCQLTILGQPASCGRELRCNLKPTFVCEAHLWLHHSQLVFLLVITLCRPAEVPLATQGQRLPAHLNAIHTNHAAATAVAAAAAEQSVAACESPEAALTAQTPICEAK